ncbi:MAG: glycosyltransferase [Anaerostipes sp.]|nr:glycosyltransferase [Anaerostipes sp.]
MNKIKILFLIHDLMHGGAEKVLLNLVNNMDQQRYDITVMTLFDVGINKQFVAPQIHYKSVFSKLFRGNRFYFQMKSPEKLYKKYIQDEYDIVVAYLEGSCTRIIAGCPNDNTVKIAWRHFAENEKEFLQGYRSLDEAKEVYKTYDKVVGVSQTVIDTFENLTGLKGISTVKYNTNETEKIKTLAKEEVTHPKFIVDDTLSFCWVSKVRPRKGIMRLAEVHNRLQKEGYQYRIYILGEGEEQESIQRYLQEHHIEDSFVFLGYDTNPYKYVARCDLMVCPSFEEGFSTSCTEALVVGTPIVTTLCSGMKEMLGEHNEYGLIVENSTQGIYDGMKQLLDHPDLLEHYTKQAKERGKYFSMERTVDEVQDMFEGLLKEKRNEGSL